jgi:hypothetical protein
MLGWELPQSTAGVSGFDGVTAAVGSTIQDVVWQVSHV